VRDIIAFKSFFTVVLMEMEDRNPVLSTYKVSARENKKVMRGLRVRG